MVVITDEAVRALAEEAFGARAMARVAACWAADHVPHEPTRRFLVEVGVPVESSLFAVDGRFLAPVVTLAEAVAGLPGWVDAPSLAEHADAIVLGSEPNGALFVLDRHTGRVNMISPDWGGLQSSSIAVFVYALAYFETHRRLDGVVLDDVEQFERAVEAAYEMLRHFSLVDPAAFQGVAAPPWAQAEGGELDSGHAWEWIADPFADGLFADWTWSEASLRYFQAHAGRLGSQDLGDQP